jgi:hypothetical protein
VATSTATNKTKEATSDFQDVFIISVSPFR